MTTNSAGDEPRRGGTALANGGSDSAAASAQPEPRREAASRPEAARIPTRTGGFFQVYKSGQGYYTRMGTGVFFGVLILWAAHFVYEQMTGYGQTGSAVASLLRYGVPVAVLAALGLLLYWIVCVNHRAIDFFIATEGEMKKVSWSSRREVIGSTKVVIATTIIMGGLLFLVDLLFLMLFSEIGVLRAPTGMWRTLFGMH